MTRNETTPAMRRYFRRFGLAMALYVIMLPVTIILIRRAAGATFWLYPLAILPALPILGVFAALGRYLVEESDEYLRVRMVRQILYATAMTLAITTVWNFLANLAGIAPANWVGVIWFVCFGVAAGILALEGR